MALKNPKQKRARALKMLEAKILKGKTNKELAKEFGVSVDTVRKTLTLAEKADIVVDFEDRLYGELLPAAHSAVLGALHDGNAKIGLSILQGTQVLRPQTSRTRSQEAEDDELARYVAQKRIAAQIAKDTHDGEIASPGAQNELTDPLRAQAALPPSPTSFGAPDLLPSPGSPEDEAAGAQADGAASPQSDEPPSGD